MISVTVKIPSYAPILVLTASLGLISIESIIKRHAKYVPLRQVPDTYLL